MNKGLVIAVVVISGVVLLLAVIGKIYSRIRKRLEEIVTDRFADQAVLAMTTRANFLGVKSKGGAQLRGNGALVLTAQTLYFIRAVPEKEYTIPIQTIDHVTLPRIFNGKSVMVPLLCIHYKTEYGEDAMAWALKDPKYWKNTIEKTIPRRES